MSGARSRLLTFSLVALLINALLAVVVHRHFGEKRETGSAVTLQSPDNRGSQQGHKSGSDTQCVLPVASRPNFQSDVPSPARDKQIPSGRSRRGLRQREVDRDRYATAADTTAARTCRASGFKRAACRSHRRW
jgi:hypothetical protein